MRACAFIRVRRGERGEKGRIWLSYYLYGLKDPAKELTDDDIVTGEL